MLKAVTFLKSDLEQVEREFVANLSSDVPLIGKIGEYLLASGGKRVRPMLLLLTARMSDYRGDAAAALAGVVEFIHTSTLLHDDVVDNADLRRGNASANTIYGNEASVLVGDFLFAQSFSMMVNHGDLSILKILADATKRLAEGEVQQLISTCDLDIEESHYMTVIRNKTAVLIAAACRIGGILGGVSAQQEQALHEFGMDLGIAFQFMDDALDYVADQNEFGKQRGHDLYEGKVTLPLIHALRHCSDQERAEVARIVELEELSTEDLELVCGIIERHQGIEHTRQRALEMVASAKQRLSMFSDSEAKEALFELADYVVTRRK